MKKWEIVAESKNKKSKLKVDEIITILLKNRGIKTPKEIDLFLHPSLKDVTIGSVGIDKKQLEIALKRIAKAILEKEQIIIFGDYDVDGICGSAILWEVLHSLGASVLPYIPHRMDEGYGLSKLGIQNISEKIKNIKLIITVDNGIVANEPVEYAKTQGIDVIITDHHVPSVKTPDALAIVHTTKLCGTGVAYLLSKEIKKKQDIKDEERDTHLELVALATVADLVPLTKENRTLVKFGLEYLRETQRPGLKALFKESGLVQNAIGVYEIGHIISPRLNAMGRLEYAIDSLRLLCTKDRLKAMVLADKLGRTNKERQTLTQETALHALTHFRSQEDNVKTLLFIAHDTYQQGVIGLVAGKLVEEFYRPAIVLSKGEKYSKASARSVHGFNIIEFIRSASEFLIDAGGHPMAAGFTVETEKLELLEKEFDRLAKDKLTTDLLTRVLKIDLEIPLSQVTFELYNKLSDLSPFGMANPEPIFVSRRVEVQEIRLVGNDKKHLRLQCRDESFMLNAIAFGMGEKAKDLKAGDKVDIAYVIALDTWNGNKKLQLKIKDIA